MNIFPPEGAEKLGLNLVLSRLAGHLAGDGTRKQLARYLTLESVEEVRAELAAVHEFQQCIRFDDPFHLGTLPEIESALGKVPPAGAALSSIELYSIGQVADIVVRTEKYFLARQEKYPNILLMLDGLMTADLPSRLIFDAIDETGEIKDSASPELRKIRRELVNGRQRARKSALEALKKASSDGHAADELPTIRAGRVVIPVRVEAKRLVEGFVHDVSATGQTVFIEPSASLESNNRVRELELEETRALHAIRVGLTDAVREVLPQLRSSTDQLGLFDIRFGKAVLANELEATVPEVGEEGIIRFSDGRNPALMLVFRSEESTRRVVPFSFDLGSNHSMVIISGPNAGGKSVTMKALGLMAAMIAMGIPIPVAEESRFDLFNGVFVDIGDEQSMADDLSTFTSHLKTLSHVLNVADENSLVLIDEAGTGTDPEAGGALARAVLERFHEKAVRTIATTHYGPLKIFAHETHGIENGSMTFDQSELRPTFEFSLGIPGSSYAGEIALRAGLPEEVIMRSNELMESGHASAEELIQDLMNRNGELARALEEAAVLKGDLTEKREVLDHRLDSIQSERERIREEALQSADDIVRGANRAVENTIREIKESGADKTRTAKARLQLVEKKEELTKASRKSSRKRNYRKKKSSGSSNTPNSGRADIKIGDQVRMLDGQAVGEILERDGQQVLVAFASMQMRTDISGLLRLGSKSEQEVRVRQTSRPGTELSVLATSMKLDIRGQRVDEAYSDIIPFVDRAMAAGLERAEIVHGKGTGALRSALHEYLATAEGVSHFEEAPISEGGAGVTLVYFSEH